MDGAVDLILEDDESTPRTLETALPQVASKCDVLLGPYSTLLMKTAGRLAADHDWLLWNHGGSGDDVESAHPGHVVSVLTPTGRYSEPFLRHVASTSSGAPVKLWIVQGKGSFGRQVAAGAEHLAAGSGIETTRLGPDDKLPSLGKWDLFTVGQFEHDVEQVKRAQALPHPPRTLCAIAAGIHEFGQKVKDAAGIFGIAQWFPGSGHAPKLGPTESAFLSAYSRIANATPDYPAIQAVAGAVLAVHCARRAGGTAREVIWRAAAELDTETLFGKFKVNPRTGAQVKHDMALVRWTLEGPMAVQ